MARYRDTKTGRLCSKATWQRSRARGGKRYKREYVKRKPQNTYYLVSVSYESGESTFKADFIVNTFIPKSIFTDEGIENFLTDKISKYIEKHNNLEWIKDYGDETEYSKGEQNDKPESVELREVHRSGKTRKRKR